MDTQYTFQDYGASADYVREHTHHRPTVGLILGSGLSGLAEQIEDADVLDYAKIPHFPISTVAGHAGRLVIGKLAGVTVCAMQGRFHLLRRVFDAVGDAADPRDAAAGDRHAHLDQRRRWSQPGLSGRRHHADRGSHQFCRHGGRQPAARPATWRSSVRVSRPSTAPTRCGCGSWPSRWRPRRSLRLQKGVYAVLSGPNFESPAEIRMLRMLGVDAVGMSTVPEALVAHHAGHRRAGPEHDHERGRGRVGRRRRAQP